MFVPFGRMLRDVVAYAKYPLWLLARKRPPDNYVRKWGRILAIAREQGCRSFIETGTFYGQTVNRMRRYFDRVVSIELCDPLFEYNRKAFRMCANVRMIHGDSASRLEEAIESLGGNILYWLDGHYSGEGTAIGESVSPIHRELGVIRERYRKGDCILIDDARMFTGDNGYPPIGEVFEVLKGIDPAFAVSIDGDCIVARQKR
ncbi:MAG: hypothetical protein NCA08_08605 [Deltaproteobacteria bacterium]|nr:hypothetical protein [Candidatus Deferrimicrobium borealis]